MTGLLALAPSAAVAQTIRGQVVDTLTRSAVGSGFVVLLGPDGQELERTLTSSDGSFTFNLPANRQGPFSLRSERIGYRLATTEPFSIAAIDGANVLIEVSALPRQLVEIEVEESSECRLNPQQNEQTASVWEEARKALAAASWTASQSLYGVVSNLYERDMDRRRRVERPERHIPHRGNMTTPFVSRDPQQLRSAGYVVERSGTSDYFAPDAHVLQDDGFVGTHCFRLTSHPDDKNLIGLAFEPAPSRRLPDVGGVLWLDRESSELLSLKYSYVNLPRDLVANESGHGTVHFMPLPGGTWIVRRWDIEIPTGFRVERIDRFDREERRLVDSFRRSGGEVLSISDSAGEQIYRAPMAEIVVNTFQVRGGDSIPVPGVIVTVENTWFEAVSDEFGVARLQAPLDGDYGIVFLTETSEALGFEPDPVVASLMRGRSTAVNLVVPSVEEMLERVCESPVTADRFRVVLGTVRDADTGLPIRGAKVTTSWQDIEDEIGAFVFRDKYATSTTADDGSYLICALEFARPSLVLAQSDGGVSVPFRLAFEAGGVYVGPDFHPTDDPYWRQDILIDTKPSNGLTVVGITTDRFTGAPLQAVSVTVNDTLVGLSDSAGVFRVTGVPPGTHTIVLSQPGYGYRSGEVEVTRNGPNVVGSALSELTPVAQVIGFVKRSQTRTPLNRVWLTLVDQVGDSVAITSSAGDGTFTLTAPRSGLYSIAARRIGYAPQTSPSFEISQGQPASIDLLLSELEYALDPITVVGAAVVPHLSRHGFYERKREGLGFFLERDDIERRAGASRLSELLVGVNGVRVSRDGYIRLRGGGPGCSAVAPAVWLDGIQMLTDPAFGVHEDWHLIIHPMDIEAVEVFTSPAKLPAQYNSGGDAACGVILIWTRRGGGP